MKFIGSYAQDYKKVLTASVVSGSNAFAISLPGWGKSEMALETALDIAGEDGTVFVEITPSTGPEKIEGAYDPAAMLNGQLKRVVSGTPYDPSAKIVILDEAGRGSDPLFDVLIHATSMKTRKPADRPVFWGTSNFAIDGKRAEALRDRFAMWYWMDGRLDVRAMTSAHLTNGTGHDATWGSDLPDMQTVDTIRHATAGQKAQDVICDLIETLTDEAMKAGMTVNPRRIQQWSALLFGYSMLLTGSDDFSTIPGEAQSMLKYCYPCTTREAAIKWAEVSLSIVDQVGAAIEAYKAAAFQKMQQVAGMNNAAERTGKIGELGAYLAEAQQQLSRWNDPRAAAALEELTGWFSKAVRGEPLK